MRADAVVLDVGETVLDRTREYAAWAAFFRVPAHTFSAVFGAMISGGAPVSAVVESFGTGETIGQLRRRRTGAPRVEEADLYPDVRACLAQLEVLGLSVAIAGNQPTEVGEQLAGLGLGVSFVASSGQWQVAKPDPAFFGRIVQELGCPPDRIVYVGDQLDNDVAAALAAGLQAVRIRRGPWGRLTRDAALEARCLGVIDSLLELPSLLSTSS